MIKLPWKTIHFIGIGGTGMRGLAIVAHECGSFVSGSDEAESANTNLLRNRGVGITIGHSSVLVEKVDLVVYSSAIDPDNLELLMAAKRGIKIFRRGHFLAFIATLYRQTVAVGGSHGKTTVAAMLSHIFIECGMRPGYIVGGDVASRASPAAVGKGDILIVEVDESDGTQALMRCSHGIIVNIDDDHHWSHGGIDQLMKCFSDFGHGAEYLLCYESSSEDTRGFNFQPAKSNRETDSQASIPIRNSTAHALFSGHRNVEFVMDVDIIPGLSLSVPGDHNRINATLAIYMAQYLGLSYEKAMLALATFRGVDRRLSVRHESDHVLVIEDYAHHPVEIRECVKALRQRYGSRRMLLVFQPHRYERIAHYATEFAEELSRADSLIITRPFNAWKNDEYLADSKCITDKVSEVPVCYFDKQLSELGHFISNMTKDGDLVVIMGAGDITGVLPKLIGELSNKGF